MACGVWITITLFLTEVMKGVPDTVGLLHQSVLSQHSSLLNLQIPQKQNLSRLCTFALYLLKLCVYVYFFNQIVKLFEYID